MSHVEKACNARSFFSPEDVVSQNLTFEYLDGHVSRCDRLMVLERRKDSQRLSRNWARENSLHLDSHQKSKPMLRAALPNRCSMLTRLNH